MVAKKALAPKQISKRKERRQRKEASAADIAGRRDIGRIGVGLPADLVLFSARRWSEFLSRPQADRIVMRNGMGIDRSLPDYRELDPLMDK